MTDATTPPDVEAAREAIRRFTTPGSDPAWGLCRADARGLGLKPGRVWEFKRRHGLPRDQRLSTDARALLALELETAERAAKGLQLERAQALAAIAQRATPEAAAAVAAVVPVRLDLFREETGWIHDSQAEAYLLNRVQALTGKAYTAPAAAWKRAATLAPDAAPAAPADRFRRLLFWGVVLRLDQLEGPPPADPPAFYRWSQLEAYSRHHRPSRSLGDALTGRMGEDQARQLLALPVSGPLEPDAIRSAYRAQARQHHPDAGGDRQRFEQLAAARDRLLLGVA